ncbi:MAG: hypothetical protein VB111_08350 [Clostridiaceae bacterium]|nr:hypothetical protein [Clostridiaceae bacterium]
MTVLDLSGAWSCAYTAPGEAAMPKAFPGTIRVPGYWDDQSAAFEDFSPVTNPDYIPVVYPMPDTPDASLPYIVGTVWYQRRFTLDEPTPCAVLELAGVCTGVRVWANGAYVGQAFSYSVPHRFSLDGYLQKGENTLLLAVDNDPHGRLGCVTRGFKGFSGGITRAVTLRATGKCRIADAAAFARDEKFFTLDVLFDGDTSNAEISYKICDGLHVLKEGNFPLDGASLRRDILSLGLARWSETDPRVYECKITLRNRDGVCDRLTVPLGLRSFRRDKTRLTLDGVPVFLRGATEHAYYPETCTPPADVETYLEKLGILKGYGFNFLRFHTSVPNEEYMTAADALGFFIQVEAPVNCDLSEWEDILRFTRRHPSVAVLCGGNEELLDEDKIAALAREARLAHTLAPATLCNPQEALRGIEYGWSDADMGDCVDEPSAHNPKRLAALKTFSDVFGQFTWGFLSYGSTDGENHELDRRLAVYERPCLAHEMGIYGGYFDFSLEKRYEGTRIGTDMYAKAREYLEREGLFDRWEQFYRNSSALMASVRKQNVETARKCRLLAGFDYLGAIDYHWHRTGYPCGILSEFYEEKPYSPRAEVLSWNSPTVLLWDHCNRFTYYSGDQMECTLLVSRFDLSDLPSGTVTWMLTDAHGASEGCGITETAEVPNGSVAEVCAFRVRLPAKEGKYTLSTVLTSEESPIRNRWTLWCFDRAEKTVPANVRVTDTLTDADVAALERGARILLTSAHPLPSEETAFQPMCAGRPHGVAASVIHPHPALDAFPHDGWCDWQFKTLLDGGTAVRYGAPSAPAMDAAFAPIVELVTGFKNIDRLAAVAEFGVGEGRLLICGLVLGDAPEQVALRARLMTYLAGTLVPAPSIAPDTLRARIAEREQATSHIATDRGYDANAQVKITF